MDDYAMVTDSVRRAHAIEEMVACWLRLEGLDAVRASHPVIPDRERFNRLVREKGKDTDVIVRFEDFSCVVLQVHGLRQPASYFSGPTDFPFRELHVNSVKNWAERAPGTLAVVTVSGPYLRDHPWSRPCVVVPAKTHTFWRLKKGAPSPDGPKDAWYYGKEHLRSFDELVRALRDAHLRYGEDDGNSKAN